MDDRRSYPEMSGSSRARNCWCGDGGSTRNTGRRNLPMVEIDKNYELAGASGPATLTDLFEGRGQLLIYHFMFDPDWDEGCESCSYLADGIGHAAHLHARDTRL